MPVTLPMGAPVVYVGTAAPVATDDQATIGARIGYLWTYTASGLTRWWVCRSAATSAAVWDETAQPSGTDPLDTPRVLQLGSAAFIDAEVLTGAFINTQNTTYQILLQDRAKVLLTTSGTNTWTLPAAGNVPDGWFCRIKNRSGNNLTVQRSGSDTIDGTTSITVATGSGRFIVRSGATAYEAI